METLDYNFLDSCMLCYKLLDKNLLKKRLPTEDSAYFSSCTKFLSSEDLGENFSKGRSRKCPLLFCQKCLVCVQELSRLNSTLERIQTKIHQLVQTFSLSFLQDRENNILAQQASRSKKRQSFRDGENFSIHEWPNNIYEDNPGNCNNEEPAVGEHHVLDENYNDNTGNYNAINEYVGLQNDFDGEVPGITVKIENEEFFEADEPQSPSFQFCDNETDKDDKLIVKRKPAVTKSKIWKQIVSKHVSKRKIQEKGNKILKKNMGRVEKRKSSLRKSLPRRAALKASKLFASLSNDKDNTDDDVEDDAKSDMSEDSDSNEGPTGTKKKISTNSANVSLKCKYCKLVLSTASELEDHIPSHDEERPFACDKCDLRFTTERSLRVHKWKHFDEKCFKCGHCKNAYKYKHCLQDHVKSQGHHKGSKKNCKLCDVAIAKGLEFILKKKKESGFFESHGVPPPKFKKTKPKIEKKDKERLYQPPGKEIISEESSFDSDSNAEPTGTTKKRWTTSGNILKCKYCKLVFSTFSELKIHITSHDEERPFACDKCGLRFKTDRFLRLHKGKHFDEKIFKCGHCENAYKYIHSFKDHIKSQGHHKSLEKNCDVCNDAIAKGQVFVLKKKMENGFMPPSAEPDPGKGNRKHACTECNKSFCTRRNLFYHSFTHQPPGTEIKCDKCDEIFPNAFRFRKHNFSAHRKIVEMPREKKSKSRQCPICGVISKGNINRHMAIHSGVKECLCPICGKTFSTKNAVGAHMVYHKGKTHLCSECGKGFYRESQLRQHYRIHTGNLIFCQQCPKGFISDSQLNQHVIKIHNKDTQNVNQASEYSTEDVKLDSNEFCL